MNIFECSSKPYFFTEWRRFFFEKDPEMKLQRRKIFVDVVADRILGGMEDSLIVKGGDTLVGDEITWADLLFGTTIGFFEDTVDGTLLDLYPNLRKVKRRVWGHPNIRKWLSQRPVPNIKLLREIPLAV